MELTKFEIRVLKHCWKEDYKAAALAQRICEVEGESVISEHVAQRWFQHFNTGEATTKDLLCSGDLNYLLRLYAEIQKKICKIVLIS